MATLTLLTFPKEPEPLDIDGASESVAANAGGDEFPNQGHVGFWVKNADSSATTITFDAPNECNFGVLHDSVEVVAAGFEGFIAHRLDSERFNDPNNMVQVTYSSVTALTVAAVLLAE